MNTELEIKILRKEIENIKKKLATLSGGKSDPVNDRIIAERALRDISKKY